MPTPEATVQPVWLVEATYERDGAESRKPFRAEHIATAGARLASGQYAMVGAYEDVSASIVIVRAETETEALAIVGDDVYLRNGVWVELRASRFGIVSLSDDART